VTEHTRSRSTHGDHAGDLEKGPGTVGVPRQVRQQKWPAWPSKLTHAHPGRAHGAAADTAGARSTRVGGGCSSAAAGIADSQLWQAPGSLAARASVLPALASAAKLVSGAAASASLGGGPSLLSLLSLVRSWLASLPPVGAASSAKESAVDVLDRKTERRLIDPVGGRRRHATRVFQTCLTRHPAILIRHQCSLFGGCGAWTRRRRCVDRNLTAPGLKVAPARPMCLPAVLIALVPLRPHLLLEDGGEAPDGRGLRISRAEARGEVSKAPLKLHTPQAIARGLQSLCIRFFGAQIQQSIFKYQATGVVAIGNPSIGRHVGTLCVPNRAHTRGIMLFCMHQKKPHNPEKGRTPDSLFNNKMAREGMTQVQPSPQFPAGRFQIPLNSGLANRLIGLGCALQHAWSSNFSGVAAAWTKFYGVVDPWENYFEDLEALNISILAHNASRLYSDFRPHFSKHIGYHCHFHCPTACGLGCTDGVADPPHTHRAGLVADAAKQIVHALRPTRPAQQAIDVMLRAMGPHFIAVHERVGDARFNQAVKSCNLTELRLAHDAFIARHPGIPVFFATDSLASQQRVKERFGSRLHVYRDLSKSSDDESRLRKHLQPTEVFDAVVR
jgi:hypothetical protein